jgi:putative phosphoesterase
VIVRVGVVADSHVGEFMDRIPQRALDTLDGCDLILHAGDICDMSAVRQLADIAPTVAVYGDHDRGATRRRLPRDRLVEIAGRRIGLTHGRRLWPIEYSVVLSHLAAGRRLAYRAGLHRALIRRFDAIDCLVYGHWHEPCVETVDGVLCFSPGAVCPWGSMTEGLPPRRGPARVADLCVNRYRRQLGEEAMRPRVGILELPASGSIGARSITID